jgi:hypothetical protein
MPEMVRDPGRWWRRPPLSAGADRLVLALARRRAAVAGRASRLPRCAPTLAGRGPALTRGGAAMTGRGPAVTGGRAAVTGGRAGVTGRSAAAAGSRVARAGRAAAVGRRRLGAIWRARAVAWRAAASAGRGPRSAGCASGTPGRALALARGGGGLAVGPRDLSADLGLLALLHVLPALPARRRRARWRSSRAGAGRIAMAHVGRKCVLRDRDRHERILLRVRVVTDRHLVRVLGGGSGWTRGRDCRSDRSERADHEGANRNDRSGSVPTRF